MSDNGIWGVVPGPICLFCGRGFDAVEIVPAELLAQPGIWACTEHLRTDGWVNRPHTAPPFDAGYPHELTIPPAPIQPLP